MDDVSPVRALLFDLGGVIIDFDFTRAFRFWASRAGCDSRMIEDAFSLDGAYEQHERGEIVAATYFATLRQTLGIDISDADFVAGWNDVYLGLIRGIGEVLSAAQQQFPLFAFTNSNPTHQSVWEVRYAEELKPFQTIFVSSDLGLRKPDPEAFQFVAKRMGLRPEEILFFDDSSENVKGAQSVGMQGVVVDSSEGVRRELSRMGIVID
jgi:epoxide hydrolase-like predicted phosphatase